MRSATTLAISTLAISLTLSVSSNATGQQFPFQNLRPVDVKPLNVDPNQEKKQLQMEIDAVADWVNGRTPYVNDTISTYWEKKNRMDGLFNIQHKAYIKTITAIKQNERNQYIWANRINPTCIEGNVYRDCYCDQGKWGKTPLWINFMNQEKYTENCKSYNNRKYAEYLQAKSDYDNFKRSKFDPIVTQYNGQKERLKSLHFTYKVRYHENYDPYNH